MRTRLISTLVFAVCFTKLFADNSNSFFEQANNFYQQKEYAKAIELYDSVLKSGNESAGLFFNLGNAYFKNGENTLAILNYEKAKKLNPKDEDAEFNLRLANLKVVDKIETLPQLFLVKWWNGFVGMNSSEQWGFYLVISLWAGFLFGAIFIFTNNFSLKRISFFSMIFVLIITILFSFFSFSQNKNEQREFAIVFSPNAYIKSAPDEQATDLFILHEGVKVQITDEVGEWKKIKLSDGKIGWMKIEMMEVI